MDDKIETTAEFAEAHAMPRCFESHPGAAADGTVHKPIPNAVIDRPVSEKSPAQWAYERTAIYLRSFEEQLDSEHEVAMGFAGGGSGVLRIEGMGYFDPDIVTFYGSDGSGARMQLVQHVTQLNVTLRALPKAQPDKAPNRIGFRLVSDLENAEEQRA